MTYEDPSFSSSKCPKCDSEMEEVSYRYFRCSSCNYENDRDAIVIIEFIWEEFSEPLDLPLK
ncbi:zinc ribbon domain-containing protein [Saccharolobus sp. A20]|uniref:zinc ribbon domain-containing protein n=1 Tax=Saccharolobus sp. A20 TaxID=1891280 RepID=UPI003182F4C9